MSLFTNIFHELRFQKHNGNVLKVNMNAPRTSLQDAIYRLAGCNLEGSVLNGGSINGNVRVSTIGLKETINWISTMAAEPSKKRVRLGDLMNARDMITEEQLEKALKD